MTAAARETTGPLDRGAGFTALTGIDAWVAWRSEADPERPGEKVKIPYEKAPPERQHKKGEGGANVWVAKPRLPHAAAAALAAAIGGGIGFCFAALPAHDVFCLDLDGCRNKTTGEIAPEAAEIIRAIDSSTEVSPSEEGVKIFFRAAKAATGKTKEKWPAPWAPMPGVAKRPGVEFFARGGYCTVTNRPLPGTRDELRLLSDAEVLAVVSPLRPAGATTPTGAPADLPPALNERLSDDEALEVFRLAHPRLYQRWYVAGERLKEDESNEDYALMHALKSVVGGDVERIERLARRSSIDRPKWTNQRDYLRLTILNALTEAAQKDAAPGPAYRFIRAAALADEPEPPWLIPDVLPREALAVLFGKSSAGKSFLAIDWALRLADQGLATVYVAAEGWAGTKRRVRAWCLANRRPEPASAVFMSGSVNLLAEGDVRGFLGALAAELDGARPDLVVLDTLNQNMPGGDENAASDMTSVIAAANAIRAAGATVLIVHHPRKADEVERGHSSLRGAADTMLRFTVDDATDQRVLHCAKQKDAAPFEPDRRYALRQVVDPDTGAPVSLVLEPATRDDAPTAEVPAGSRPAAVLDYVAAQGRPVKHAEVCTFIAETAGLSPESAKTAANRVLDALVERYRRLTKTAAGYAPTSAADRRAALENDGAMTAALDANETHRTA